ncbi:Sec-independent protein translocase protein TatB [Hydromonas duriensis]|uniref:Sec-independent protein translocase protein TatB n=1 Tax=Hydromonas duriensis TaxID=1527608 RepID=A0A4R6Y7Q9_9BURK|nr:Sec-independent protein translocase protein TatB [Hydromonas duriensis]TDR31377.1 sec-independent protein translocase protein TatB [Hydromonas duriensis]
MFDLGISKLVVIGVVGLIVLGPERLPKVARVAGTLFGRAQRYLRDVKDEVARDMSLAELKEMGRAVNQDLASVQSDIQKTWHDAQAGLTDLNAADAPKSYSDSGARQRMYPSAPTRSQRTGRAHWRVKTGRTPAWFKQHHKIRHSLSTEAARMSKHRRYAAHIQQSKHSFF